MRYVGALRHQRPALRGPFASPPRATRGGLTDVPAAQVVMVMTSADEPRPTWPIMPTREHFIPATACNPERRAKILATARTWFDGEPVEFPRATDD